MARPFRFRPLFFALFVFLTALPLVYAALTIPPRPLRYVYDGARLISPPVNFRLDDTLRAFETKTSNQIFIATFPSLEGESLEDYSLRLAEAWKPGQKGRDNGAVLLIFRDERKIRIEVGYGLEGALTDGEAGKIIRDQIAPYFRVGAYEQGIVAGVEAMIGATEGEYKGSTEPSDLLYAHSAYSGTADFGGFFIFILMIVIFLMAVDLFRYRGYRMERRLYNDRYTFWEWWFRFGLLLFLISTLFRMLFYSFLYGGGGYYGSRRGFGTGRGGGFSGGGGGRFGGGGASGGW